MPDGLEPEARTILEELFERPPMSDEEFRFRVEPLRPVRHRAIGLLFGWLGDAPKLREVAAAVLHEIATEDDEAALLAAFRDFGRPPEARAEIAQVLAGVAGDHLTSLLDEEELATVSAFSIETLLVRYRDRAGLTQVIELYVSSDPAERHALLDAVAWGTAGPNALIRLGPAYDPLFEEESDEELRQLMIGRLRSRPEPASARTLARWAGATHGEERRAIKKALRRLGTQGIRTPGRETAIEAWASGTDGTGCYNIGLAYPTALGLRDVVLCCISLEAGIRAVSLIAAVDDEAVTEIRSSLELGQRIPVATLDPALATARIHEGRASCERAGRALPSGFETVAPYLARPLPVVTAEPPRPGEEQCPPTRAPEDLLDEPGYESWGFPAAEIPEWVSVAIHETDERSDRIRQIAQRVLAEADERLTKPRLVAMLKHQAWIHKLQENEQLAYLSRQAAEQIMMGSLPGSPFAVRMMERSLCDLRKPSSRAARPDVRETFKRKIEHPGPIRRQEVLVLDLAEALCRQAEDVNETLPGAERLTFDDLEVLSLEAARAIAREITRDAGDQTALPGFEQSAPANRPPIGRRLGEPQLRRGLEHEVRQRISKVVPMVPDLAGRIARALVTVALWFTRDICLRRCHEGCLARPDDDGRRPFYSPVHPAGLEPAPSLAGTPNFAASGSATRRVLSREIESAVSRAGELVDALRSLGTSPREIDSDSLSRVRALKKKLAVVLRDLDQVHEDPASIYSHIEEKHALVEELSTLEGSLVERALGGLRPAPQQFAGFDAYPEARAAWLRFSRMLRNLNLKRVGLRNVQAALDRVETTGPVLTLLCAARPCSSRRARTLSQRLLELRTHTPRACLGARTPYQIASEALVAEAGP